MTPFATPPFNEITPEHFLPAFEQAFADHSAEIAAITNDPAAPTSPTPSRRWSAPASCSTRSPSVFYDLVSAHSNPAILEIDKEVSLRMARHWNPIMMNAVLFGRIAQLHENRANLGLDPEQLRLLERTYTRFHRAGAGLSDEAKTRMAEINEKLAQLGTGFSHHLLGDEQDWFMELGEADRQGLPESFVAAARAAAEERGMDGKAVVTLSRSSIEPFLKSLGAARPAREGLQGLHRARRQRRCQRQQRDHRRDPERCATNAPSCSATRPSPPTGSKTPWPRRRRRFAACWSGSGSRPAPGALADRDAMQALIAEEGGNFKLAPWDWRYYAEKLRQRRANFDDAEIKPYLHARPHDRGGLRLRRRACSASPSPSARTCRSGIPTCGSGR